MRTLQGRLTELHLDVAEVEMAAEVFQREAAASLAAFRLFRLCCVLEIFL